MSNLANILGKSFNANEVEPQEDKEFGPIPDGYYVMVVTGAELNQGDNKSGLKMEYTIIEGKFKNRKVWDYINLTNPNEQCVKIGHSQLSALCLAVGVPTPEDTEEIKNLPFVGKVTMGKPSKDYDPQKGTGFAPKEGVTAWLIEADGTEKALATEDANVKGQNVSAPAPAPAAAAQGNAPARKPWEKN